MLYTLSQHIGLEPPYGTCGQEPLTMYEVGTNYTYSRCAEQCATKYASEQCQCVDAYMPGTLTARETMLIFLSTFSHVRNMFFCSYMELVIYWIYKSLMPL